MSNNPALDALLEEHTANVVARFENEYGPALREYAFNGVYDPKLREIGYTGSEYPKSDFEGLSSILGIDMGGPRR